MQNIPGIALKEATEQMQTVRFSAVKKDDQQAMLFADLFNEHANRVENELALAPVSNKEKMLEAAPETEPEEAPVNAAGTKAPVKEDTEPVVRDKEARMTQEELDEVKDDLKEYGMSDEEIAKIEEKVNSEEGMTWGEFVSVVAHKMAEMRQVELSDGQKDKLMSFFSKFGFTEKESAKLVSHLEKGHFAKVMKALKAKLEAMPQDQPLLIDKKEVEAFTAAMGFSKELTTKIQELFGANTLPKDVKQAFTLIRQELAEMDKKDEQLVRILGKAVAKAMGDESKATTVARQIAEAVDLKPRVAEEKPTVEVKEDLAEAVKGRKEVIPEANVRKASEDNLTSKAEIKTDTRSEVKADTKSDANNDVHANNQDNESDENWNNFFGKMREDGSQASNSQAQIRANNAEALAKAGLTEADARAKAKAWEKVSAPKVMKQVDNAFLKTLNNGAKQLTLQLTPENLGKLSIVLSVQGKEVGATIRAESPDAARIIADNIDIIKNSLESQGLKVEKLDVQTGLNSNQDYQDWFGENEHNLSREREAMIAMRNHMKQMRKENGDIMAQDLQQLREQAITADQGLHIIA